MCDCGLENVVSEYADDVHKYCEEIESLKQDVKVLRDVLEWYKCIPVCGPKNVPRGVFLALDALSVTKPGG